MMRSILVLTIALLALPSLGQAQQDTAGLVPGRRVRVQLGKGNDVVGMFLSADTSTMRVLTAPGDTTSVDRAAATSLDVSVGRKSKTLAGALIGAPAGALAAASITYIAVGTPGLDSGDEELIYVAAAAVGGFFLGGIGGALIGSGKHTDMWEPTVWPVRIIAPGGQAGNGIAFGVHLSF